MSGICEGCGAERLTPGVRSGAGYLCLECSDPVDLRWALCHYCWSELRVWNRKHCDRCKLGNELHKLLDDGSGEVRPELRPFVDALVAQAKPAATMCWLRQPGVRPNLRLLASGAVPVSHEGLNTLTPWRSIAFLRDLLMECGSLPRVDRYLIQFERWLADFLAAQPDPGRRMVLERFATWHLLRRLRDDAARQPLIRDRTDTARAALRRSAGFLDWLAEHRLSLDRCRQQHLDRWVAELRDRRYVVREALPFLYWCMDQHLMMRLVVTRTRAENPAPISQDARLTMIRDLLTGESYPLVERVVSMLVLLYAQPVARIARLTVDDVLQEQEGVFLRLGTPPSPVPEPFASLLLRLLQDPPAVRTTTNRDSPWLLPGGRAGQPMTANYIRKRVGWAGVPNVFARTAALRELVLQAPAPVVAGMIGIHPVHAAYVTKQAGTDWSRYAPGDHSRNIDSRRPKP